MTLADIHPVEYVIAGHVTEDHNPTGVQLGGGVTYSGLTAHALGNRVRVLTAAAPGTDLSVFGELELICLESADTTTFENRYQGDARLQLLRKRARPIAAKDLPIEWLVADVLHLAPVADEIEADWFDQKAEGLICLTPQGWLRRWDSSGVIGHHSVEVILQACSKAAAVVLSLEDLNHDLEAEKRLSETCQILVVTDGSSSIRLYAGNGCEVLQPPQMDRIDPTGAGDIFSAAFFSQFAATRNPIHAANFASQLAAISVTRTGLAGIPSRREVQSVLAGL